MNKEVTRKQGPHEVRLERTAAGINLHLTTNGEDWYSAPVDRDTVALLEGASRTFVRALDESPAVQRARELVASLEEMEAENPDLLEYVRHTSPGQRIVERLDASARMKSSREG
ncbi:hypothetical protein TK90_2632 (plasmid) [Thioalkalivibrio sp. K90mix]|uniref:hypothetical protein n=1 Tax=Thioalkalivibrio sp. (strain K90mix) TaxID=396595 RepID=UPI000195AB94|nr:hypothetical protein [Thioalkalivibrio sp. K90mix]ADC73119.1 hypothetical protein TK90_2632 [Thioalkalivibrio sp. K90mix]